MDTGENGDFPICARPLRIAADAGLSEGLRHKARHKYVGDDGQGGQVVSTLFPFACVYVAVNRTAGHSKGLRSATAGAQSRSGTRLRVFPHCMGLLARVSVAQRLEMALFPVHWKKLPLPSGSWLRAEPTDA